MKHLTLTPTSVASAVALALAASTQAQQGVAVRLVTDETGTYLVRQTAEVRQLPAGDPARDLVWTFDDAIAIAESVALSGFTDTAWVGQTLNAERLQRFDLPGDNVPDAEFPAGPDSPSGVDSAQMADLTAFLDRDGPFTLEVYTSTSAAPKWTHTFPANYNSGGVNSVAVSRDGSTVACVLYDSAASSHTLFIFDAAGNLLRERTAAGFANAVELTDDGSLALLTQGANGRVIETATGTELFSAAANGAGGRFNISGNGDVLVLGGFDLRVFRRSGDTWVPAFTFSAPTSWFGNASAVSRDGSTVGVLSHDYGANYLRTSTRIFDVATGALLGTYDTVGSGAWQGAAADAAMSDDGNVLAVAHWGTQDNAAPEVLIFDRAVNLIGSIDTPGSVFSVDVSGDGRYVLAGSKAVHANVTGNGGRASLFQLGTLCRADCDSSGATDVADFVCFRSLFLAGDDYADYDGDGNHTPADFAAFRADFLAGCP